MFENHSKCLILHDHMASEASLFTYQLYFDLKIQMRLLWMIFKYCVVVQSGQSESVFKLIWLLFCLGRRHQVSKAEFGAHLCVRSAKSIPVWHVRIEA